MESAVLEEQQLRTFRRTLLWWYSLHARDLPWRRTQDPYCIWISEIMLQQTRVAAVVERYRIFVERFPSLVSLALAGEDEILAVWSGLGYYKRARLLHRAAQFVLREHAGTLPQSADALRKLPGIGVYTAAAVASIAFNEPIAVVDGNVERVLTRVLGMAGSGKSPSPSLLRKAADRLLAIEKPGTFNQAMMELGATVCLPQNPLCMQCPVMEICRTQGEHPVVRRKQMRSRLVAYGLVRRQEKQQGKLEVLLQQRPAGMHRRCRACGSCWKWMKASWRMLSRYCASVMPSPIRTIMSAYMTSIFQRKICCRNMRRSSGPTWIACWISR